MSYFCVCTSVVYTGRQPTPAPPMPQPTPAVDEAGAEGGGVAGGTVANKEPSRASQFYDKWQDNQKALKRMKGTGMMPPWAMGVYFFFATTGLILFIIGMAYAWRCSTSAGNSHVFLTDYCCRDGTEPGAGTSPCSVGKTALDARLETGANLPTNYLFWTGLTAVLISSMCLLALTCWIAMCVYTANYRKSCLALMNSSEAEASKGEQTEWRGEKQLMAGYAYYTPNESFSKPIKKAFLGRRITLLVGFIIPLALGCVVLLLASLNYGYTAFQEWPESVRMRVYCGFKRLRRGLCSGLQPAAAAAQLHPHTRRVGRVPDQLAASKMRGL